MIPLPRKVKLDKQGRIPGSRGYVEATWITFDTDRDLHAPAMWHDEADDGYDEEAVACCGASGWGTIPGLLSRMGGTRCPDCCRLTGIPQGDGSPKNDQRQVVRDIVGMRVDALSGVTPWIRFI